MNLTAQVRLRDLLRTRVAPVLRAAGYSGSGQNFHRRIGSNWAAINVQRGSSSTSAELTFTVNLGTASTEVRIEDGWDPDEPAAEVECHWRTRLGALLPGHHDRWWTVRSDMLLVELEVLGDTIADHLTSVGLPMLEAMATDEAILATWLDGEPTHGMVPAAMDVVGPILRRIGPPERLASYLSIIDNDGLGALSVYSLWDEFPVKIGPKRLHQRLERLAASGSLPRQSDILDLGWAPRPEDVRAEIRPFLDHPDRDIRWAAAWSTARLKDVASIPRLISMVRDEPSRRNATQAAFALARLNDRLPAEDRSTILEAIRARRARAVGHDRAALSELVRRLTTPAIR